MSKETKLLHMKQYESEFIKVFLRNLDIRLQDKTFVQNPDTPETAMGFVLDDEHFR